MNQNDASKTTFPANQVMRAFQISATKQTLFNNEERGEVPQAERMQRGKTSYRVWELNQLPLIGEKMGFLRKPEIPKVISIFSLKGGTSKSSLCFQLARSFALHNVRTLVIGLDAQETITQTLARSQNISVGEEAAGIYHVLAEGFELDRVIQRTDLETLHFIPETIELSVLDIWLKNQMRKEYVFKERLINPLLSSGYYDLILFDCNPAWSEMVTGALGASDNLLSPLGADINSLKAAKIFVELLADFQEEMKHTFKTLRIIPTMVEPNKLSQTILARYRVQYEDLCTAASIRRAIAVQESNALGKSLMEVGNNTAVFQDFIGVLKEINTDLMDSPPALHAESEFSHGLHGSEVTQSA
jgi:chromosome partitioning protein